MSRGAALVVQGSAKVRFNAARPLLGRHRDAYRTGMEFGHGGAAFNLGVLLVEDGDQERAKDIFRTGMELGNGRAAFNLGPLEEGRPSQRDKENPSLGRSRSA